MIVFHNNLYLYQIIKRHAGSSTGDDDVIERKPFIDTSQPETTMPNAKSRHITQDAVPPIDNEIQIDIAAPLYIPPKVKRELTQEERLFLKNNSKLEDTTGNEFEHDTFKEQAPFYIPPNLCKETLLLDQTVKVTVAQLDELSIRVGKEIQKSDELAVAWRTHLHAYDEYIKSLSTIPWKKVLIASATLITIFAIGSKIISLRALPNFIGNIINLIPTPKVSTQDIPVDISTTTTVNIPKPDINNTIRAAMETPLTPLTLAAGVGTLTIILGVLKITLWVLRKTPK